MKATLGLSLTKTDLATTVNNKTNAEMAQSLRRQTSLSVAKCLYKIPVILKKVAIHHDWC